MVELYKAIVGSPITYLTSDISAAQTTISIADDSALPDAPNICTIGYGENIETIRYGAKSNGVLRDVTRGIEGIPRAWSSGTEVARFFTAHDHNAIINTLMLHLAESSSKHIKESGSNENGSYIRFDDGTQICWHQANIGSIMAVGEGTFNNLYRTNHYTWVFPKTFTISPSISITVVFGSIFTGVSRALVGAYQNATTTQVTNIQVQRVSGGTQDGDVIIDIQAIGRWK